MIHVTSLLYGIKIYVRMIFEESHTYLETTMLQLSHDMFIVDKN